MKTRVLAVAMLGLGYGLGNAHANIGPVPAAEKGEGQSAKRDDPATVRLPAKVTMPLGGRGQAETRIRIPKRLLNQINQAAGAHHQNTPGPLGTAPVHTVIAGLALSVAAACTLLLVMRKAIKPRTATAAVALLLAVGGVGTTVANFGPPPEQRRAVGTVLIEITDKGEKIEVLVGRIELDKK